ncbi:MAG: hypothetical protein IJT79_05735 [Ruminococcus sp.]|nr:hypothetical protein [Ruminococcus sp.]
MKEKYYTPFIDIEILEKSDILLTSTTVDPTIPEGAELENAYHDIGDFIMSGPGEWFS